MEIFDIQVHLDILYTAVPRIVKEMVGIDLWAVVAWMNIFISFKYAKKSGVVGVDGKLEGKYAGIPIYMYVNLSK